MRRSTPPTSKSTPRSLFSYGYGTPGSCKFLSLPVSARFSVCQIVESMNLRAGGPVQDDPVQAPHFPDVELAQPAKTTLLVSGEPGLGCGARVPTREPPSTAGCPSPSGDSGKLSRRLLPSGEQTAPKNQGARLPVVRTTQSLRLMCHFPAKTL